MKNIFIILLVITPLLITAQNFNRYIIKVKNHRSSERLSSELSLRNSEQLVPIFEELNLHRIISNESLSEFSDRIAGNTNIEYFVRDEELEYRISPDDQFFSKQYAPGIIKATEVWNENTGGLSGLKDTIVIAVLDLGLFAAHEDLKSNIWKNYADKPGDKIDNDGNNYIDDHAGLDLSNKNDNLNSHYHGTGVAGIIGATGNNNLGITGINWNVKILPVTSIRYVSDVIEAYNYVYNLRKAFNNSNGAKGAFIVCTNLSAGYDRKFPSDSQPFTDWCNIYDLLGSQGILNITSASNDSYDVEKEGDMPTLCTSKYLIAVTSTDSNDKFDISRAFGKVSVDIAAPGREIYTLTTDNAYKKDFSGNSAAAPHVAGAIGLLYTIPCKGFTDKIKANPSELSLKIKDYILDYSDKHTDLKEKTVSGGRLNIFNTYLHLAELCGELPKGEFSIVSISPNPAYDRISVSYDVSQYDDHIFSIYNAKAQLVKEDTFRPNIFGSKIYEADISTFPVGVYYLKFSSGNDQITKPFIISRK
ncbi:MAG: S8 family serine peptidase [Deltaproteobacteria bacterium]